ncbi:MAG TPA: hypothetical protein EYP53_08130 [Candidatus Latescibacteria bacterium]|nr:hypothetical protein [Candidatus Latescibacterota bacterium]
MVIRPIAFESMGTRSMATLVTTDDCSVLIDPGVSLAPLRYNLPPHPLELQRETEHWIQIVDHARGADVLVVTHYHYDHHNPGEPEIFTGKVALVKHPRESINRSQQERAAYFLNRLRQIPGEFHFSDGEEFTFGKTNVRFSKAVYHGANSKLGYVTEVLVKEEFKFLHTSDVEGPVTDSQVAFILEQDPDILFCDGPMTYMLGVRYSQQNLKKSINNLIGIIQNTGVKKLILDHHFLRDLRWRERIGPVFEAAEAKGVEVLTAAQFGGLRNDLLEARRRELYGETSA